jgi:hypothetical protein
VTIRRKEQRNGYNTANKIYEQQLMKNFRRVFTFYKKGIGGLTENIYQRNIQQGNKITFCFNAQA